MYCQNYSVKKEDEPPSPAILLEINEETWKIYKIFAMTSRLYQLW